MQLVLGAGNVNLAKLRFNERFGANGVAVVGGAVAMLDGQRRIRRGERSLKQAEQLRAALEQLGLLSMAEASQIANHHKIKAR